MTGTRPIALRVPAYPADYPGNHVRIWCAWCGGWQYHSDGYGYCRPHTPRAGSQCPYQKTGYILTDPSDLEGGPAARLEKLIYIVLDAEEEERGSGLRWAVRQAAELVTSQGITRTQVISCFAAAALEVGIDAAEADRTIMSALGLMAA
jgi:hypothetical protein